MVNHEGLVSFPPAWLDQYLVTLTPAQLNAQLAGYRAALADVRPWLLAKGLVNFTIPAEEA